VYACICAAVTDAAVQDAVRRGVHTVSEISAVTGAGTGCGSCHDHLCDIIERLTEPGPSVSATS
jgi:bacterioferritin-associated ferredoxin